MLRKFKRQFYAVLWAILIWTCLQYEPVNRTFVGLADYQGLFTAMKIRENSVGGVGAPVTFIDFSEADWKLASRFGTSTKNGPGPETGLVPRKALAEVIDFAAASKATAVIIDVDSSVQAGAVADKSFADAVDRWRKLPSTPLLILVRGDFSTPGLFERAKLPPIGPNDPIVEGTADFFADQSNITRYVNHFDCARTNDHLSFQRGYVTVANVSLYASAAARANSALEARNAVSEQLLKLNCGVNKPIGRLHLKLSQGDLLFDKQISPINFHFSLKGFGSRPAAIFRERSKDVCDKIGAPVLTTFPVSQFLTPDAKNASKEGLCGAIVVVGASAPIARDRLLTSIGEMPGALIVANAARGGDLAGQIRRVGYIPGVFYISALAMLVCTMLEGVARMAIVAAKMRSATFLQQFAKWVAQTLTHPITATALMTQTFSLIGLVFTFFLLDYGYWAVFAAPAFAAAMTNMYDQFSEMRKFISHAPTLG
jgi:CHASE2 domain